jgi:adenylosuccinate lyase
MTFEHLWGTPETDELFGDEGRTRIWLAVLGAVAAEQGALELIPGAAADAIAARCSEPVDLEAVGEETRRSGHSTLGLIRVLQRDLDESSREWVSYGTTVQDVADTWTGLAMQRMLAIAERDLAAIEASLVALARRHRDAIMLGRTHGQPGLPITFAFKAAGWIAEVRRHRSRIEVARPRLEVGQLAGAVGTLSAWGSTGPELQRRVLERLGLAAPEISWTSARDRVAEFVGILALITGTLAKIGNEVYNLQRPEIGELSEAPVEGVVGSITMPQKRNPERSEHLVTLARVVRANAGLALEGLVAEHERDGAAWKAEWSLMPQACGAATVALALACELAAGLEVDERRMRENVEAQLGYVLAEPVMLALGAEVGPRRAHELVHAAARRGHEAGRPFREALADDPEIAARLPPDRLDALLEPEAGAADALADRVLGE